jgi:hypothetical protein
VRHKTAEDKKRLSKLLTYARDINHCRREALLDLLDYEGEKDGPGPRCCDVCEKAAGSDLREEKSLADFFGRNRHSYTVDEAADILARAENLRWPEEDAREAIDYLLETGALKKSNNFLWKDKIRAY